ncbi:apolipoprotein A-I-like [Eublepharis macularius]|uniref:Apolipoprotein A-I-like n=1 Tax=Eublepharis macularius TaxID=481883 RepID=A0AA97KDM7_EUBMA|nr:apolipoprotein A-I-like [Eublepharis macularius]
MKLLVIVLAWAVFTESRSLLLRDEPRSKLAELAEELQEYTRNISNAVTEKMTLVRRSELGQQLEHHIQDSYFKINRRWNKLRGQLPSEVAETYELVASLPIDMTLKAYFAVFGLTGKLIPAAEELYDLLHPMLAPHTDPVLKMLRPHAEALSARAQEVNANLNEKLKSSLEALATRLALYAENVRSQWQEFQTSLEPFADQVQEWFEHEEESARQVWQPYVAPVEKAFRQFIEEFYGPFPTDQRFSH